MMACIVPSRGRPDNVKALIESWAETLSDPGGGFMQLHVMIDDDDPTHEAYLDVLRHLPRFVTLWIGPRRRLGGSLNHLAPLLAGINGTIGFMGDDHRPRTKGWDLVLADAVGPTSVVYGNDLIQGPALPTAVFMGSTIVRTLGWFVVPGMTHLFMDNLWKTIGEQLGTLRYLPEVIIEHVHPIAGKAEWDQGYAEANADHVWDHDEAIYKEWVAFQMPADIAAIKEAMAHG